MIFSYFLGVMTVYYDLKLLIERLDYLGHANDEGDYVILIIVLYFSQIYCDCECLKIFFVRLYSMPRDLHII